MKLKTNISFTHTAFRKKTDRDAVSWAKEAVQRGAGEILLTSMDSDGEKNGFDHKLTKLVSEAVPVPVIASGGAGNAEHMRAVFEEGKADAKTRRLHLPLQRNVG